MARARSPEYPAVSLKEAIDRVKMVYDKDYQNPLAKAVIAEHMGYKSLSGASLPMISALTKYGLLEGRGADTRVSDLAVTIIAHPVGTPERMEALKAAASMPELFAELDTKFQNGNASDQAIRSYLLTSKFIPGAADAAIRAYRDTKQLVEAEAGAYHGGETDKEAPLTPQVHTPPKLTPQVVKLGQQHAAFPLPEGDVSLSFPAELSVASAQMMASFVKLLLEQTERQAKSREYQAGVARVAASGETPPRSIIGGAGKDDEAAN